MTMTKFGNAARMLAVLSAALSYGSATGFAPIGHGASASSIVRSTKTTTTTTTTLGGTSSPAATTTTTTENETFQRSLLAARIANSARRGAASAAASVGAASVDPNPVNIGWDTHKPVDKAPDSLVRPGDGPEGNYPMRARFEKMIREAQISITDAIEKIDGTAKFREDSWVRANGGGGMSRVLKDGAVWEKAGVNLSVVYGSMPQEALQAATERGVDRAKGMAPGERVPFFACGLSCVMHPRNPHCPTMHFNYRYFETDGGVWWFGGGTDITPSYLDPGDMAHFHGTYRDVCDKHDPEFYPKFKAWADRYFVIPHRNETRGLGGIFFDDMNDRDPELLFEFAKDAVNSVVPAYGPIIEAHKDDPYTQREKEWQQIRRGRYVEFNLVYDRGTVFGLKTGGRIESILMSLPETARWEYNHQPEPGSPEAEIMDAFKHPREWV